MDSGDWALVIAGISLAVSITQYRLSGARLTVRLAPVALTPSGTAIRGPDAGWTSELPEGFPLPEYQVWSDLAVVVVTNVGRSPISVSQVGLDIGAPTWWKPWNRHFVTGEPVPVIRGLTEAEDVRIESGQAVRVYLDLWGLVGGLRRRRPEEAVILRGTAQAAGKRWPTLSARRKRWRISHDTVSLWPFTDHTAEVAAYQELWRRLLWMAEDSSPDLYWPIVRDALRAGGGKDEIETKLREVLSALDVSWGFGLLAFYTHRAYSEASNSEEELEG